MDEIRIGSHVLQPNRQLLLDGEHVHIGPRALAILTVLAEAKGEIVTKDELLDAVWHDVAIEENALHVHVVALRKALGADADRLKTIRGIGYQLVLDDAVEPASDSNDAFQSKRGDKQDGSELGRASEPWWRQRAALTLAVIAGAALLLAAAWQSGLIGDPGSNRVAVMPLTAVGDGPEDRALANGITEELIVRLRRIPELQILSGRSGNVSGGNTLHGTVRTNGNLIRVSVRLQSGSGRILWSDNFDRSTEEMLYVQEELAASIANALGATLEVGVASRRYGGTDNPEAFARYADARANRYATDRNVPISYLERAVALDPAFNKALAELTYQYGLALYDVSTEAGVRELLVKMDDASSQALENSPGLAISHIARMWFHWAERDWRQAEASLRRAIELDTGDDPEILYDILFFLVHTGRLAEAAEFRHSRAALDPMFDREVEGIETLILERDYEGIIEADRKFGQDLDRPRRDFTYYAFWSHVMQGNLSEAEELATNAELRCDSGAQDFNPFTSVTSLTFDEDDFPSASYEELARWAYLRFGTGGVRELTCLAVFSAFLGDTSTSVNYLRLAQERPSVGSLLITWTPQMANTRQTEQFVHFVEELGVADAWKYSGRWGDYCEPVSQTEFTCH